MPELQAEATNPQGYGPAELAEMNTAGQQSAGGTQSGATGEGALLAARTKNPGTAAAAIGQSARTAGEIASKGALGTQVANAQLKQRQQQAGLTGEENLTGLETGAGLTALGQVAPDVNANTGAANESWNWAKYILDPAMADASSGASTAVAR
jgi:hypothetical protein